MIRYKRSSVRELMAGMVLLLTLSSCQSQVGSILIDERTGSWDHHDWNLSPESASRVRVHPTTHCIELFRDGSRFAFAFDPTEWETITDMTVYHGKLYLGACADPMDHRSADIIEFDDTLVGGGEPSYRIVYRAPEEGVARLRILDDLLVVPGYDSKAPRSAEKPKPANFYTFDGHRWEMHNTIPRAVMHTLDMCEFEGKWYASVGDDSTGHGSVGPSIGKIFESEDHGQTWREVYAAGKTYHGRIYDMAIVDGKLYGDCAGSLVLFDGKTWTRLETPFPNKQLLRTISFHGKLIAASVTKTIVVDGRNIQTLDHYFKDFVLWGDHLYAFERKERAVYKTPDGLHWERVGKNLIPEEEFKDDPPYGLRPVSLELYHDRLYIGTSRNGKVYVTVYPETGSWISQPFPLTDSRHRTISWKATVPDRTAIVFQIRTAATREALERASFTGPDGTAGSFYTRPGEALTSSSSAPSELWIQYKAILSSENGEETPSLRSVTITGG